MPVNGMGMMPGAGMDGPNMGMWSDPNMGGWGGEEPGGGRAGESSYGEEAASDHQYGEASHDRSNWPNSMREKIEVRKGTGLAHLRGGTGMIEIKDMREMHPEKKMWDMIMNGPKEGIVMTGTLVEKDLETVIGKSLETAIVTVIVTAKGIVNEIVIVTGTGKTGTNMQIIIGIVIVKQSMMMNGKGGGHRGHTANHGYLKRRNIILGPEMLIMGSGGG
ncbi:uncharacterized protein DS421_11g323290 [Arachis hypogaea]|nr:uncharacterized protein DS421_11g323290 [Arachis hypogaea]